MSYKQPTSLVKFTDAESAINILSESTLRWSAPCLFDDPFELNHRTTLNFDSRSLLTACVKSTLGLIFSRDDPKGNSPLIKAIRRWRTEDRFDSEEEAQEVLTELLTSMVQHREPEVLEIMRTWKQYSRDLRILCLSDGHDDIASWKRYANNHTGVAIRFACGEETSMEQPMPVKYSDTKPEISPLAEQMDILMNQSNVLVQETFPDKFLCKSKQDSKEKEWRLLKLSESPTKLDDESKMFEQIRFQQAEVRAIYFGAEIENKPKNEIATLIKRNYPKAKVFQAIPRHQKFELEFERLQET
ncbi:MAG: DUF2971 domain-containing protein [Pseudomonadales bacterium]|nr:DUF2971 domain-containing protein [Pseudomonadales bacterium]